MPKNSRQRQKQSPKGQSLSDRPSANQPPTDQSSSDQLPDEYFVAQVLNGDTDAYATLMARYETKLHRYVVYLIHDPSSASDAVQETFLKAYQNLRSFNNKYKFSSWLYRIAHNEAMNIIRKNRHIADGEVELLADDSYDAKLDELTDKTILQDNIQQCLDKLDSKYREVIQLAYLEAMKYEDISDILRIPTSTVGVRLARAKDRLKKICQQKGVVR